MAFSVFSPRQAKTVTEQRMAQDASRAQALINLTKEITSEKDKVENEFKETLKRQTLEHEEWLAQKRSERDAILKEVNILQNQKEEALKPLLLTKKALDEREKLLEQRESFVDEKETSVDETSRILMEKLDTVAEREQVLDERENAIKRQEKGIEIQKNQIIHETRQLTDKIIKFKEYTEETENNFAFRKSELDAQANLQNDKNAEIEKKRQEIQSSMKLLIDQRILLDKGFEELRKKHG